MKCAKKVGNQADVKSLETVVALVEVCCFSPCNCPLIMLLPNGRTLHDISIPQEGTTRT